MMSKIVCEVNINGEDQIKVITTAPGTAQYVLRTMAGKPFWCWNSIPTGTVVGADFTGAPIATDNAAQNLSLINAITAQPENVLTYQS